MLEEIPQPAKDVFLGGGSLALLGLLAHFLLRIWSRGKVATTSDRSEISQLSRLEFEVKRQSERADREAQRADTAFQERNQAIAREATALGELRGLRSQIAALEERIKTLEELLTGFYVGPDRRGRQT